MRIYVSKRDHNEGYHVGSWLTLPMCPDDLQKELNLIIGEDDECEIQDYVAPFHISKHRNPYLLNQIAELDAYDYERFVLLVNEGIDWDSALEGFEKVIFYKDMSLVDIARRLLEKGTMEDFPDATRRFLDVESVASALSIDGYIERDKGTFLYRQ